MRRKIDLYIGGLHADLAEQDFILYNYAFTDLQEPAAVKNSFSKQITLPATPANLAVFGHPERADRTSTGTGGTGPAFSPGYKTPFELRNELGGIIESGYLRLDAVEIRGRIVTGMKVTLFGGIGGFFYNLSYTEDGEKKTLAHLDYGVTLSSFTINAAEVSAAWARLRNHAQSLGIENAYDVVNFAPAYNGVPDGDFDAKHAVIAPGQTGLPSSVVDGDKTYHSKSSVALLNLKEGRDEWACKDLRSYLQRPVLSMRAFLEACARPANNGGHAVDLSHIPADLYVGVWKTLPMIPSLGDYGQAGGSTNLTAFSGGGGSAYERMISAFYYVSSVPAGSDVQAQFTATPRMILPAGVSPVGDALMQFTYMGSTLYVCIFLQMVAYSGNVPIGASTIRCICDLPGTSSALAEACGYTPTMAADYAERVSDTWRRNTQQSYSLNGEYAFDVASGRASVYVLEYACYNVQVSGGQVGQATRSALFFFDGGVQVPAARVCTNTDLYDYTGAAQWTSPQGGRTGAVIPYSSLLNSAHTPAEYLISFCKANGLVFGYNPASKAVTILPRNEWFNGQINDLSGRVDRSQPITIQPLAMKSKWYEMQGDLAEGAFAEEYKGKYGTPWAVQRINTGYDFDAAAEDLLKGNAFRGAVTLLDSGPYWNRLTDSDGYLIPSVFLDPGNTYTLWTDEGEGKDFPVPVPSGGSVRVDYYNTTTKGYDMAYRPKLEFRSKDGKGVDGVDVLCRYAGSPSYAKFALTDDTAVMLAINNGKPCWNLTQQNGATTLSVPLFHRYNALNTSPHKVTRSLDYGTPKEVDLPGVTFDASLGSMYLRSWKAYLVDLLDMDTKVMRCRVDLGGLQVGPELLRLFWYYDGAYWVLNKITNYSLTTWDAVECEFVQVRDMAHYTNGQNL